MSYSSTHAILVTGATGNVGAETVASLVGQSCAGKHYHPRILAAVRDPDRFQRLSDRVQPIRFDFMDPATWSAAMSEADTVFLVRPPAIADIDRTIGPFIDQLAEHAIRKIVFLSLQGAERMPYVPHYKVEKRIEGSGIPFVFLRPSFFMQNLTTIHRMEIAKENCIFVPAGNGKTNFIDVRDIAEAAAKVLLEAGHEGRAYELTGPDSLDYFQVAALISDVLGRQIQYHKPSIFHFMSKALLRGQPFIFTAVQAGIYLAAALGKADHKSDDFENLMGRKAGNFRNFATEMRSSWV